MGKIYNIAQFGAFDVNSFGDSMFPVAARTELAKRVTVGEFILFSPVGAEESYNVNGRVYAYDDFNALHQKIGFDLIIIGGGEMFHFNPIAFDNKKDGRTEYAPGYIWREPVRYAMDHKIPYLFFGVGAPFSFSGEERDEVYHAVMHAVYTGVRDIYSLQRVEEVMKGKGSLTLQPDGLWLLDSYFDQKELEQARNKLRRQKGSFAESKYMVVQYGTTYQYRAVAKELKKVAKAKEWKIVLLPVNYCHEDIWALRLFYEELGKEADFYDKLLQPLEITALISGAKFFVGTSLHGNLVASLYGVKNLVFDMYGTFVSKMDGFLYWKGEVQHTTIQPECISGDIEKILASPPNIEQAEEIRRKLAICYDSMARAIKGEGQEPFVSADNGGIPAGQKCYFTIYPDCGEIFSGVAIGQIEQNLITFSLQLPKGKQANGMEVCLPLKEAVQLNIIACRDEGGDVPYEYQNIIQPGFICLEKIAKVKILCSGAKELSITAELKTDGKEQILSQFFEHYNNMKNELEQVRGLQLQAEEKMQFYRGEAECKKAHIEQLMQSERELQSQLDAVHNSRTWRAASLLHKPVLWLLPADSKRRLFAKMFVRLARHPVNSVKMLSPMKIRHFVTFLKEEGPAFVSQRMDESMLGVKIRKTELDLEPMDEKKPFEEYGPLYFNEEPKPVVSIVIPVYNQFSYTYHCLQSILKNSGEEISYEVIIANDCSTDDTTRLSEIVDNVRIVTNQENLRFLKNCNHAAQYAKGEYILFLNNDTQVQKNWLKPLVELMERDSAIGLTGSKLVYANGMLQEAGGIIWKDASAWNYGNRSDPDNPEFNYVKDVDYISGASILIRTSLWKEIGGFDEYFAPAYCEDSDLAFEVRKRGYRVVYQPASVVVHFEGISNGTDVSSGIKQYQVKNNQKLKEKWADELAGQFPNGVNVFKARERGQGKKTIVFIDHYVPHFDQDAGSKTIYQYLKMFVKKGYIVKFIGDNFYRHEPYTSVLQQLGIEVLYGSYYAANIQEWICRNKDQIDVIFLNRPHISVKYIDTICGRTDIKAIYYGHDLHFLRFKREYELTGDIKKKKESEEWFKKEMYLMKKADISYYPSVIEEEEVHRIAPDIAVKAITAYAYDHFKDDIEYDFSEREGILFVGGFGHEPNADAVLWFVEEIWPVIREKLNIEFYIVGSHPTQKIQSLNGQNGVVVKGFVSDEELEGLYASCKITVVPLRYGAGVKGKVVEALYNGMPVVTTPVGAEGIPDIGEAAIISSDPKEFAAQTVKLYQDNGRLKELAVQAQKLIKAHFSMDAVWDIIKDDFE